MKCPPFWAPSLMGICYQFRGFDEDESGSGLEISRRFPSVRECQNCFYFLPWAPGINRLKQQQPVNKIRVSSKETLSHGTRDFRKWALFIFSKKSIIFRCKNLTWSWLNWSGRAVQRISKLLAFFLCLWLSEMTWILQFLPWYLWCSSRSGILQFKILGSSFLSSQREISAKITEIPTKHGNEKNLGFSGWN